MLFNKKCDFVLFVSGDNVDIVVNFNMLCYDMFDVDFIVSVYSQFCEFKLFFKFFVQFVMMFLNNVRCDFLVYLR